MTCFLRSICVVCLLTSVSFSQNWPQWRGPARDGHSPDKDLKLDWTAKAPELLWMASGTGQGYASLAVVDGVIYTTGNKQDGQYVVALKADGGEPIWERNLTSKAPKHGYEGSRCTPTVDGGRVYAITSDGAISCLDAKSGEVKWSQPFSKWRGRMMSNWGFSESPLIDGDLVLCTPGGKDAMVVALNKMTGEEAWKCKAPASEGEGKDGAGYSSIAISNGAGVKQYVTLVGRGAIGVRASDGKLLWTYNKVANETANIPTPICHGNFVLSSSGYGGGGTGLVELSKDGDGVKATEKYWLDRKVLQNHHGGMIQVGDYVYLGHGHGKGKPTCLELASGEIKWGGQKNRGVGTGSAAISMVGETLIFRYESGELALIKATPDGYELKGAMKPEFQKGRSWSHPVICRGRLYLREQDKLMCYQL